MSIKGRLSAVKTTFCTPHSSFPVDSSAQSMGISRKFEGSVWSFRKSENVTNQMIIDKTWQFNVNITHEKYTSPKSDAISTKLRQNNLLNFAHIWSVCVCLSNV